MKSFNVPLCVLVLFVISACSSAGEPKRERMLTGEWQIITAKSGKNMLCYTGTAPVNSEGSFEKRAQPYLMATRRASGKIEISTSSGYPYKQHSKVEFITESKSHGLFFKNDTAWARNDAEDKAILTEMKKSSVIKIRSTSEAGVASVDTYSTKGFADAISRIKVLCP